MRVLNFYASIVVIAACCGFGWTGGVELADRVIALSERLHSSPPAQGAGMAVRWEMPK